jgi:hypothetical protein
VFHPYSFYLQKHKNAKIKRESALPFSVSPYYSTSLSVPPMPQTSFYYVPFHLLGCSISPFGMFHFTFWDVPFYLLWYPILPFGMSHFTIWGIPFHHLGYIFGTFVHNVLPRFSVCLLRFFAAKYMRCLSIRFFVFYRNSFGWISHFL